MAIERLEEIVKLPWDADAIKDPELRQYLYKLVKELEREHFERLNQTVNLLLGLQAGTWVYFSQPDPLTGDWADGSIRIGVLNEIFVVQKKQSGTWTTRLSQD